ncbi:hypothetical protein ACFQ0X_11665 [Streptomyces rectiviolaceus]|uniref:hypothetical protein n=1 Tax=Streptomyces rectiviolaceus TaxID=332591 RepID=UPI003634F7DD
MGPLEWLVAAVVVIALVVGLVTWNSSRPGPCGDGLEEIAGECVGVTDHAFDADERTESLIEAVADENARVRQDWENPSGDRARIPYVRVALMMPFTSNASSAMTGDMIRRALAGPSRRSWRRTAPAGRTTNCSSPPTANTSASGSP